MKFHNIFWRCLKVTLVVTSILSVDLFAEEGKVLASYLNLQSLDRFPDEPEKNFHLSTVEPGLISDLYLAFYGFAVTPFNGGEFKPKANETFKITPLYTKDPKKMLEQVKEFKKRMGKSCNILVSVGGWGFNDPQDPEKIGMITHTKFSEMVSKVEFRKEFIDSCLQLLQEEGFDGVDLDWEYPGDLSRGGKEEDLENFITLLKEMRQAFMKRSSKLIISVTLPAAVPAGLPKEFQDEPKLFYQWIAKVSKQVDRIQLMAYDYHGPFDRPKLTGVNAPLYRDFSPNSTLYIDYSLNQYLSGGTPKEKILLGMPLFGHGFMGVSGLTTLDNTPGKPFEQGNYPAAFTQAPGLLAYFEVEELIDKGWQTHFDIITSTMRCFNVEKQSWISYDNAKTIAQKAEFAKKRDLAGAFFWSIDMDQFRKEPRFPVTREAANTLRSTPEKQDESR